MKKRMWLLLLWLLCLAMTANAEPVQKIVDFQINCGPGETTMPDYPDFAAMIGEGLTDDDFIITYPTSSSYTFHEDGSFTVAEDETASGGYSYALITYTPKVEGVGVETVFKIRVMITGALTYLTSDVESIVSNLDYTRETVTLKVPSNVRDDWMTDISYDADVVSVTTTSAGWKNMYLNIIFAGAGETDVVVTAYNGMKVTIPVKLYPAPTKVSFAKSHFTAQQGATVDLGLDMGNGTIAPMPNIKIALNGTTYSANASYNDGTFFPEDASHFYAGKLGLHEITMTTNSGLSGKVTVFVCGTENCTSLAASKERLYERETVTIEQYGADGGTVYVPMSITGGSGKARLVGNKLTTIAAGDVEITAHNPDGTTCVKTFEIEVTPTEMYVEAAVTLEIGDGYEPDVTFDQGSMPYTIRLTRQDSTEQYLYTTRLEGNRIIAQAPGTAVYTVTAGELSAQITVTVQDSDKAISIVKPQEPFPTKQSCQIYVKDKTGAVYPATFTTSMSDYYGTITPGGYFTASHVESTFSISAMTNDGRHLSTSIQCIKIPQWLQRDAVVMRKSATVGLNVNSDVGPISSDKLIVEVANEKIVTVVDGFITPKKTGKTTITVTSIYDETVTTTFTVEVISDTSTIYIGTTSMSVPAGSSRYLPIVTDADGDEVTMVWTITHQNPGEGNPEDSGFTLDGDVISCTWPTATCEVTGTVKGGSKKVKVTVTGYQLPENIAIEPLEVWLDVGESQNVKLATEDDHGGFGVVYWIAETEGVINHDEVGSDTHTITGAAEGATLLGAVLENGSVAVCAVYVFDPAKRLPGDVNEDGVVDETDALLVSQYAAGWNVGINGWLGDVNADGQTNMADALLIYQYCQGLSVQLKQSVPVP